MRKSLVTLYHKKQLRNNKKKTWVLSKDPSLVNADVQLYLYIFLFMASVLVFATSCLGLKVCISSIPKFDGVIISNKLTKKNDENYVYFESSVVWNNVQSLETCITTLSCFLHHIWKSTWFFKCWLHASKQANLTAIPTAS